MFGQLLLSFPTGRLPTRARRRVVAASYVLIPLAPVPALLVSDADQVITDCRGGCPRNVLLIERDAGLTDPALALGSALSLVLCLVAVGMLVRQWRAAAAPERRSLLPVFASGGVSLALVAAYAISQVDALLWMAFAAFAATPFAFLAGLARADLSGSRGVRTLMAAARGRARARGPARRPGARARRPRAGARVLDARARTATSTRAGRPPSCPARTTHAAR